MMTLQILKSVNFTKTQKSRYLESKIFFSLQKKNSLNAHQGLLYGKEQFCSRPLTYKTIGNAIYYIYIYICYKVIEEWGDIFENLKKREGHFEIT